MPKYVAINIGASQIQYLLADIGRKQIQVLNYGILDLNSPDVGETPPSAEDATAGKASKQEKGSNEEGPQSAIGERLAGELARVGGTGARAIIALGRADVDVCRFTLPPASDAELAELVAIQVLSDMGAGGTQGVVDYVAQPAAPNEDRQVEAVIATDKTIEAYQTLGRQAGIKLQRLVLRPYALASLLSYFPGQNGSENRSSEITLLVNRIAAEVDLIAVQQDQVLFWRTVQLDSESSDPVAIEGLTAEIARTVAIAPTHLPAGCAIERIQLLGCEQKYARLAGELAEQSDLCVEVLDPCLLPEVKGLPEVSGGEQRDPEDEILNGWAAPLVSILLAEAATSAPAIDLLNPRKPPTPRNNKRVALLSALAGLILFTLVGTWLQEKHAEWDQSNKALTGRLNELNAEGKKLVPQVALVRSIAAWESAGIIWLDELRDLSQKFPSAEDVMVRGMAISSLRGGKAMIRVTCQVRDPAVIVKMDHDLRDKYRTATSTNFREQGTKGEHPWRFETVITTRRRSVEDYLGTLSPRQSKGLKQTVLPRTSAFDSGPSERIESPAEVSNASQGSTATKGGAP
ncbi:MAG: hypothetical protein ABGX16_23920 [Pirellulales bacterium]